MPQASKAKDSALLEEPKKESQIAQVASTKNIIENNLFDPERGSGTAQVETSSVAMQRIRKMSLVGTVILGTNRYAILEEPASSTPGATKGQSSQLHLKLGDIVEGFKLIEVNEKGVVFTNGASKVNVSLDFFRRSEPITEKAAPPAQTGPGLAPRIPRTEKAPAPPVTR